MENEPSVLDYLKSKLMPWKKQTVIIPSDETPERNEEGVVSVSSSEALEAISSAQSQLAVEGGGIELPVVKREKVSIPWLALVAVGLALAAQRSLEPTGGAERAWLPGVVLYVLAIVVLVAAFFRNEWTAFALPDDSIDPNPRNVRWGFVIAGIIFSVVAFLSFTDNLFTPFNVSVWALAILCIGYAFWVPALGSPSLLESIRKFFTRREWNITISWWTIACIGVAILAIFFRTYLLDEIPSQMISDQAEKLFDVSDVLNGYTHLFFPRNTGREAFQFYLTAAIAQIFGTGISFMSLKIGTVLAGLLTLPYLYLLGKEFGNKRIGFLAVAFAGIAYWANTISRFGLRFPFYPVFAAPVLYYLLRGLRTGNRNDFIASGIFLGIGLHGYTPFRMLPFVILIAVGLYLLQRRPLISRARAIEGLLVLAFVAFVIFLPLLRYTFENPEMVAFRTLTRVGSIERPLPGPAWQIFLDNLLRAMTSFAWDDGEVWVISITHRPMLDVVSAAFFYMGAAFLLVRFIRKRQWQDLFMIISIPVLMAPSIMSLAFPGENPCLNRTSGAIVPVFLIVGIMMDGLIHTFETMMKQTGKMIGWGIVMVLLFLSCLQNYDLVFNQYRKVFDMSAWNTSEMGQVTRMFMDTYGSADTAWLVGYPHWADSRLVMLNAGLAKDNAIWPDHFKDTVADPRAKQFLINLQDTKSIEQLKDLYPQGLLWQYQSQIETKNFWVFLVPPQNEQPFLPKP